jgi:hypothetical protein
MPSAPVRGHFAALQRHPAPVHGNNTEMIDMKINRKQNEEQFYNYNTDIAFVQCERANTSGRET